MNKTEQIFISSIIPKPGLEQSPWPFPLPQKVYKADCAAVATQPLSVETADSHTVSAVLARIREEAEGHSKQTVGEPALRVTTVAIIASSFPK